jgi:hypothetical protein
MHVGDTDVCLTDLIEKFILVEHGHYYDGFSGGVVCLHQCGGLGMPHFFKNILFFDGFSCVGV